MPLKVLWFCKKISLNILFIYIYLRILCYLFYSLITWFVYFNCLKTMNEKHFFLYMYFLFLEYSILHDIFGLYINYKMSLLCLCPKLGNNSFDSSTNSKRPGSRIPVGTYFGWYQHTEKGFWSKFRWIVYVLTCCHSFPFGKPPYRVWTTFPG